MMLPQIAPTKLVAATLAIAAVASIFVIVLTHMDVLLLPLAAIILGTALRPALLRLTTLGLSKTSAALLIFALVSLVAGLLFWYALPILAQQSTELLASLADGWQLLRDSLARLPNILVRRLLLMLPESIDQLTPAATGAAESDVSATLAQGRRLLAIPVQTIAVIVMAFFWLLEGDHLKKAAYLLLPASRRADVQELVEAMELKVGLYIRGQGILCLLVGLLALLAYGLIGLPNLFLLALLAGIFEALPIIGPLLGAIPAFMVGLSISPAAAVWVLLASGIIQQLENSLLVPRVMKHALGVRPLMSLLALVAFGSLFGFVGALIALPLAAVFQLLLDRLLLTRESLATTVEGRDNVSVLRYQTNQLVQDVRNQLRRKDDEPSALNDELDDEIESIALDLESYLARLQKANA